MLKLQTPVDAGKSRFPMTVDDRVLVMGSCFADNVGSKMKDLGLNVCINPFGTLYNPVSILNSLRRLASGHAFGPADCVMMGSGAGRICSFSHHTSFSRPTQEEFLAHANSELEKASAFYTNSDFVLITLGTSRVYRHSGDDVVVSNCLKRDAREFVREDLGPDGCVRILEEIVNQCIGDGKKVIFTVSPVRHLADGAHGNMLSKAALLLAVDRLCREHSDCDYFPAYEIVMDELRDYRFYAEDMTHPSGQTVNYIWERFCDFAYSDKEKDRLKELEKAFRQSLHRNISK